MNPREDDKVSAVALIVESEDESGETTLDVSGEEIVVEATEPADDNGVIAVDDEDLDNGVAETADDEEPGTDD